VLQADFVIEHADLIATCAGPAPRRGLAQRETSPLPNGVIAAFEGRITYVGDPIGFADTVTVEKNATRIDARGCCVVPGFVDPHTHVIYAGDRGAELRRRLAGDTYAAIAAGGGGIIQTVAATRAATEDELVEAARPRLDEMLACGTTTCEAKSGYGLELQSELRQLRAIRRLDELHAVDIVPTFMGAHQVPAEYRTRRSEYIALVIEDMLPRVADEGLAEYCDVFCEPDVFTPEESIDILEAGRRLGLTPRVQLSASVPRVGGSGEPDGAAGGIGTSFFSAKIAVYEAPNHRFKVATGPTLQLLGKGIVESLGSEQSRVRWGLPVSAEVSSGATRLYGGGGYFSPGLWFSGVAAEEGHAHAEGGPAGDAGAC